MVNEVFLSHQGEGIRAGTLNVFLRLSKCNMRCAVQPGPRSPGGFDCDTEFESGRWLTVDEVVRQVVELWPSAQVGGDRVLRGEPWVVVTGGEPALQLDLALCDALHAAGFRIAVETNGSLFLPLRRFPDREYYEKGMRGYWEALERESVTDPRGVLEHALSLFAVDWITVSPKVAEHAVRQLWAHELKYVRGHGQAVPTPAARALHRLISPAFSGLEPDPAAVAWCAELARENPEWRLTVQLHKLWKVR
jgi:organic radical activating enzyme